MENCSGVDTAQWLGRHRRRGVHRLASCRGDPGGGGNYFIFVEGNQPKLKPSSQGPSVAFPPADIVGTVPLKAGERHDSPDLKRGETVENCHGRIEPPRLAVRTKLPPLLDNNWPGSIANCRIERIREHKTYRSRAVV